MLGDVIDLAILGCLKESECHGYELKQRLREVLGPLSSVSFGSLYPALARLEATGAVEAVDSGSGVTPTASAIPGTGSFAGEVAAFRATRHRARRGPRGKKVYGLTETGTARLEALLSETEGDDDRSFNVALAFCRWATPSTRIGLLQRRRVALVARLAEGRRAISGPAERLDRYVRSLLEHDTETTVSDIAWLDRLLDAEHQDQTSNDNQNNDNQGRDEVATTGRNQP